MMAAGQQIASLGINNVNLRMGVFVIITFTAAGLAACVPLLGLIPYIIAIAFAWARLTGKLHKGRHTS